jgi:hypothetical protein
LTVEVADQVLDSPGSLLLRLGFGCLFSFQPDPLDGVFLEDLYGGGHCTDLITPAAGGDFDLGVALGQRLHGPGHGLNGAGDGPRQAEGAECSDQQSHGQPAPGEPAGGAEVLCHLLLKLGLIGFLAFPYFADLIHQGMPQASSLRRCLVALSSGIRKLVGQTPILGDIRTDRHEALIE